MLAVLVTEMPGQAESFPYRDWVSADGKTIVARLTKMEGKSVTLQLKKGGRRYAIARTKLSEESNKIIDDRLSALKKKVAKDQIDVSVIYQAVALGLKDEVSAGLIGKRMAFPVTDVRKQSDHVSAFIVLGDALFLKAYAPKGTEFYEKEKGLYTRPSRKNRIDGQRSVNKLSRLIAQEGKNYEILFSDKTVFEFGTVGVSDGVIIHN